MLYENATSLIFPPVQYTLMNRIHTSFNTEFVQVCFFDLLDKEYHIS